MTGALTNMQQRPYRPPNVAGWEGGMSWLNTNTVQGRFDAVVRAQFLKYSNNANSYPRPGAGGGRRRGRRDARRRWSSARTRRSAGRGCRPARATRCWRTRPPAPTGERAAAPAALLHRAGADARRPRRAGDVTMRCIECEEIELARVSDAAARADAGDPARGARRLPGRPLARRPDAPAAAAVRRRRARVGLRRRRRSAGSRCGSRSPRRRAPSTRTASCCSTWPAATTA